MNLLSSFRIIEFNRPIKLSPGIIDNTIKNVSPIHLVHLWQHTVLNRRYTAQVNFKHDHCLHV